GSSVGYPELAWETRRIPGSKEKRRDRCGRVDRLPQQGEWAMLGVLAGAGVVPAAGCGAGQLKGVVEFAVGKESGVTGDGRAVELQLDWAVGIDAQGVMVAVTHEVPRSEWQRIIGTAGISGVSAQISCRTPKGIWEMWVKISLPRSR